MPPRNIALMGVARSGKDSIAERLRQEFLYTRVAFADPLKEMALRIDPFLTDALGHVRLSAVVHLNGWERAKDEYPEVRRLLQEMGQTVRQYDEHFWVNIAAKKIANAKDWNLPVVVTDVRYPNEYEMLKRRGFKMVRVVRPIGTQHRMTMSAAKHDSETALKGYPADCMVYNGGSLAELHQRADALART